MSYNLAVVDHIHFGVVGDAGRNTEVAQIIEDETEMCAYIKPYVRAQKQTQFSNAGPETNDTTHTHNQARTVAIDKIAAVQLGLDGAMSLREHDGQLGIGAAAKRGERSRERDSANIKFDFFGLEFCNICSGRKFRDH